MRQSVSRCQGVSFEGVCRSLLLKLLGIFVEPDSGSMLETAEAGEADSNLTVALVPLGQHVGVAPVERGLRKALAFSPAGSCPGCKGRSRVSGGLVRLTPDMDDVELGGADVAVLVAGRGSHPALAALCSRSLKDRGLAVLIAFAGPPGAFETDGWEGVADHCLHTGGLSGRLAGTFHMTWTRFGSELRGLARHCLRVAGDR